MPIVAQIVGEPVDQRRFGADHDQPDRRRAAEIDDGAMVGGIERDQLGMLGDAGIARRRIQLASGSGDCASFQASACSRPPEPMSRTFMTDDPFAERRAG